MPCSASAMLFWHARHRFRGLCGSPTRSEEAGHMRRCTDTACDTMHFPRTDPAFQVVTKQIRYLADQWNFAADQRI